VPTKIKQTFACLASRSQFEAWFADLILNKFVVSRFRAATSNITTNPHQPTNPLRILLFHQPLYQSSL
jgi:hypothetical protein